MLQKKPLKRVGCLAPCDTTYDEALLPHLKEGGGCIVNLGSSAAKRWDGVGYGPIRCSEMGRALSAAACEWAMDGIRTNVILPHATSPGLKGWVKSPSGRSC